MSAGLVSFRLTTAYIANPRVTKAPKNDKRNSSHLKCQSVATADQLSNSQRHDRRDINCSIAKVDGLLCTANEALFLARRSDG